jgi:mannose-6-phosphate isomerase-like protein (cupin superfamily)
MSHEPINLDAALASFAELWRPHIIARVNDYDVRVVKLSGEFVWHVHENTDEFFMVLDGELRIGLREDGRERAVQLKAGDVFVVPKGVEHCPSSPQASVLLFEPAGTPNTGDRHDELPEHIQTTAGQALPTS